MFLVQNSGFPKFQKWKIFGRTCYLVRLLRIFPALPGAARYALASHLTWCEALSSAENSGPAEGSIHGGGQTKRFFGTQSKIWFIIWMLQEMGLKTDEAGTSSFILVKEILEFVGVYFRPGGHMYIYSWCKNRMLQKS